MCEAYSRAQQDAATPYGVVRGPVCPVQNRSSRKKTLAMTRFFWPCVPVVDADTQGGGGISTRERIESVPCSASLNLTQSVATHKLALSPLISKTYRTEP